LRRVQRVSGFVGRGQMRDQVAPVDALETQWRRQQPVPFVGAQAEPVHAGVDMQDRRLLPSARAAECLPEPDLLGCVQDRDDAVLGEHLLGAGQQAVQAADRRLA
jgi:hypothetical protein